MVFEDYTFDSDAEKGNFLQILSKLRHLRYLSLKGTHLKYSKIFSKSICKLQNLVTLDIRDAGIRWLYSPVAELRQLHHLLVACSYNIFRMKPEVLRNLKDLQTLVGLQVNNMEIAEELGYLTQLMKLEIEVKLESQNTLNFLCVSLEKLSGSLLSLSLTTLTNQKERLNLNIQYPPSLLQRLQIGNKKLDELEVIKTLPNLLCLTIFNFPHNLEELLFRAGGFQNLKMLEIKNLGVLKSIEFQMDCMPVLEKLVIISCWKLLHVI
ncbi:hypothetical protein IEQ34_005502 [Dendrobium chrysotoxum]|uniref:Disease resistance R13L4/SHOC-2-like LRR domain-containing protein n=1 Tax=Dendrobium chrysotoxum TaxID=161865 RepID=A0AAV7HBB6_DENCH|nr:hypothetical protein IEQ34_005502 [Dendrobium chrysotoxum]